MPEVLFSFISVFTALAVVLFLVWLSLKRWQARFSSSKGGALKVEEMIPLGGSWRAAVVSHRQNGKAVRLLVVYGNSGVSVTALDS